MNQMVLRACANLAQASPPNKTDSPSRRCCVKLRGGTVLDRHAPGKTIGSALSFAPPAGKAKISAGQDRARQLPPRLLSNRHKSALITT
jgi:hypothetical protein